MQCQSEYAHKYLQLFIIYKICFQGTFWMPLSLGLFWFFWRRRLVTSYPAFKSFSSDLGQVHPIGLIFTATPSHFIHFYIHVPNRFRMKGLIWGGRNVQYKIEGLKIADLITICWLVQSYLGQLLVDMSIFVRISIGLLCCWLPYC